MKFKSLDEKINHARTVEKQPGPLPFKDICDLIQKRSADPAGYLTYIDIRGKRTAFSYREFYNLVVRTAAFLSSHKLEEGDRIATISHNHWQTVVHYFASWLLGLVVVPVNLGEEDSRIEYILKEGNVKLAFVRADYEKRIADIIARDQKLSDIITVICDEDTTVFQGDPNQVSLPENNKAELEALIVFTSGTTGAPKAVVLSQSNLLQDARAISEWHHIDNETKMMCVLPVHHVNGTVVTLLTPFYSGGSVVLNQKFSSEKFFSVIKDESVHIVSVVPTLLQYLNSYNENKPIPHFESLRHVICGAGPLTVKVAETFEERFGIRIIHGYGLSETTCYSCFVPTGLPDSEHIRWRSDFGYPSIGIPLPVNEM
ncbi:MAG: class I adenylate-forming enzyme family protein, partial [Balneolaceae bacterium]